MDYRNHHQRHFSVKSHIYFIHNYNDKWINEDISSYWSLNDCDNSSVHIINLPFFTFTVPDFIQDTPLSIDNTSMYLIGNIDKNR